MNTSSMEAPSPAPSSNVVVPAQELIKYTSSCSLIDNVLSIKVIDNITSSVYKRRLDRQSPFWKEDGKYFQNDIHKLYDMLELCFTGKNEHITLGSGIDWKYTIEENGYILLYINYEGLFGFTVTIKIPKENTEIDQLRKKISDLQTELEDCKINFEKRLSEMESQLLTSSNSIPRERERRR